MEKTGYYTMDDFEWVDKIDTHIHVFANRKSFVEQAKKDNFRLLNIMVDLSNEKELIKEQYNYCFAQKRAHPEQFEVVSSFSLEDWDHPNFVENTLAWLDKSFDHGAIGVKVWKNIGMDFRDKDNHLIRVDDPKLDAIFNHLASKKIPLIGHLGEPKNCWLPLEEMTTNNDRDYFAENPQYHMYQHPELPSYEEQIVARDKLLEKHPDLVFIGAHMGSIEWSVDELAKRLDKFPNMCIDLAARVGQVFYQTAENREKVRDFFIAYQDRILYGTDLMDFGKNNAQDLKEDMHSTWLRDWRFFVTDEEMTSDLVNKAFKGLKLPKEVVDKLYLHNAQKWLSMFSETG